MIVELQNSHKVKLFLTFLARVAQVRPAALARIHYYLLYLLVWADDRALGEAPQIQPGFPVYAASRALPGKGSRSAFAPRTQKKIIETSQFFFRWAKATYPKEFSNVSLSWIESFGSSLPPQPGENLVGGYDPEIKPWIAPGADETKNPLIAKVRR